jgi:hypothetical protein
LCRSGIILWSPELAQQFREQCTAAVFLDLVLLARNSLRKLIQKVRFPVAVLVTKYIQLILLLLLIGRGIRKLIQKI